MSRINNTFDLTGFVGADPEKRFNPNNGNAIVSVSLGVDDSYRDRNNNELVERTDWFDLTVYRDGLTGIFEQYVRKGSEIHVRGHLRKRKWESKERKDEQGQPKMDSRVEFVVTEVRLLRRPKDSEGTSSGQQDLQRANAAAGAGASDYDDDIPM